MQNHIREMRHETTNCYIFRFQYRFLLHILFYVINGARTKKNFQKHAILNQCRVFRMRQKIEKLLKASRCATIFLVRECAKWLLWKKNFQFISKSKTKKIRLYNKQELDSLR